MSNWQYASNGHGLDSAPMGMAEPMHRIPPTGVTSMASIRDVPKSCIQKVKDICLFYVEKCSGDYSNNKAAARYVHHMAEEIISQLSGVADEIKRNRTDPEMFQSLINEWNAYFPKNLQNLGSPKQIALLLKQQETTILQLKDELKEAKSKRSEDVEELLKSMDNQLHSYKHSVLLERNHMKLQIEKIIENSAMQLSETKKYYDEEKQALVKQYERMLADQQDSMDNEKVILLDKHKREQDLLYNQLDQKAALYNKKFGLLKEKNEFYKEKYTKLCNKYKVLVNSIITNKKELKEINDEINDELLVVSDDSNDALESDDLESLEALEKDLNQSNEGAQGQTPAQRQRVPPSPSSPQPSNSFAKQSPGVTPASRRRSSLVRDLSATYSDEKKEKLRLEEANLFANAQIKSLQTQLEEAEKKHQLYEGKIVLLQKEIEEMHVERNGHFKRIEELEDMVHALRQALASKLVTDGKKCPVSALDSKYAGDEHVILCHTPHFLDYPDRHGAERGTQRVTAYYTSGRF